MAVIDTFNTVTIPLPPSNYIADGLNNGSADNVVVNIEIGSQTLDLSSGGLSWTFTNWDVGFDFIEINGSSGNDDITGSDEVNAGEGVDVIAAGDGDDIIRGFTNGDSVDGGSGSEVSGDTIVLKVQADADALGLADDNDVIEVENIDGSAVSNLDLDLSTQTDGFTITGSGTGDTIKGSGGTVGDDIDAGNGNDEIVGFTDNDDVDGGDGTDKITLETQADADQLGDAADLEVQDIEEIDGTAVSNLDLDLSTQTDGFTITGSGTGDTIKGSGGTVGDDIDAGNGNDEIVGFTDNDDVDGGDGTDKITLETQADADQLGDAADLEVQDIEEIDGTAVSNLDLDLSTQTDGFTITGSGTGDTIKGSGGTVGDDIDAGNGNDEIVGFTDNDDVDGGDGTDKITLETQADADQLGDAADLEVQDIEEIDGTAVSNLDLDLSTQTDGFTITGSGTGDTIKGSGGTVGDDIDAGNGNDEIVGFTDNDDVDGGDGTDKITLETQADADQLGDAADLEVQDIEEIDGTAVSNLDLDLSTQTDGFTITGSGTGDTIKGSGGTVGDDIDAGNGNDEIVGFTDNDDVDGGDGTDKITLETQADADQLGDATDLEVQDIEEIDGTAVSNLDLDLSTQTDGFTITGSGTGDTIKGSGGTVGDDIDAGNGNDEIVGFTDNDDVDGGDGTDKITLETQADADQLGDATDLEVQDIEEIDGTAVSNLDLDLSTQTDGFTITGSGTGDTIKGSGGTVGDDIDAGNGNDEIVGFTDNDDVDGGDGTDKITLETQADADQLGDAADLEVQDIEEIDGTAVSNLDLDLSTQTDGFTITGSGTGDTIKGSGGTVGDDIDAGNGNDEIVGFTDNDDVDGGDGTDKITLETQADADQLGDATDLEVQDIEEIDGTAVSNLDLDLSTQTDGFTITGSGTGDTIKGSGGTVGDDIDAGNGNDEIVGFTDNDDVDGGDGTDKITLETQADADQLGDAADLEVQDIEEIDGTAVSNLDLDLSTQTDGFTITGSGTGDTIKGSGGTVGDDIDAGNGNDEIVGFTDNDDVDGGDGTDKITLETQADADQLGDATDLEVQDIEEIDGTAVSNLDLDLSTQTDGFTITGSGTGDTITGSTAADAINAGGGDDEIIGFTTGDDVDGGSGSGDKITLVSAAQAAALSAAANGNITNVEEIDASGAGSGLTINLIKQNDGFIVTGSAQGDTITGSTGNDDINAGAGDDEIVGFLGNDTVDGGTGSGDQITLANTSNDLNDAANGDVLNIEIISAAGAAISSSAGAGGITIDLSKQSEGFAIIGSGNGDKITGSSGDDDIDGGNGADLLTGRAGFDVIDAGGGNDVIAATNSDGNDFYNGGSGSDWVDYSGTSGGLKIDLSLSDRSGQSISGPPLTFDALMLAGGLANEATPVGLTTGGSVGTDVLYQIENAIGSSGNDTMLGSSGANILDGSAGNDKIWARAGNDTVRGGSGNDLLVGGFGGESGSGSGDDVLMGEDGNDELFGEDGKDQLWGGAGSDQYAAGAGKDTLYFEADRASDTAWGGDARDTFVFEGKFGTDTIKDFLAVGKGDKIDLTAFGSKTFDDLKIVQKGNNVEITGLGNGRKIVLEVVNKGALTEKDFIFAKQKIGNNKANKLKGSGKDDYIVGKKGNDTLKGKDGDDEMKGDGGKDKLIAGNGDDTGKGGGGDDTIEAGAGDDNFKGNGGADILKGEAGDDILNGGGGNDSLEGGTGSDILTGGSGSDGFIFQNPEDGIDTITDFTSGADSIVVSAAGFGGGLSAGGSVTLVKMSDVTGYVHNGSSGVFLLDNSGSGQGTLYWDATGGSSDDAVAFANIGTANLIQSDFDIV